MTLKQIYENLREECPVEIIDDSWKDIYKSSYLPFGLYAFLTPGGISNISNKAILLGCGGTLVERIIILLHETCHARHDLSDCKCMKSWASDGFPFSHLMTEYHAHKDLLKKIYDWKNKSVIKAAISMLQLAKEQSVSNHGKAIKKAMKLKIYKKCVEYVGYKK